MTKKQLAKWIENEIRSLNRYMLSCADERNYSEAFIAQVQKESLDLTMRKLKGEKLWP